MELFATKLNQAMRDLHLTQKAMANIIGCSRGSMSMYLSGKATPPEDRQRSIAIALDLPGDYFQTDPEEDQQTVRTISPEQAAKIMHLDKETVRKGLQQGVFPWGYAIHMESGRWVYYINAENFEKTEGVKIT